MFELNPQMEITAVNDIGPDGRCAIVIDKLYENPDAVRDLAIKLPRSKNVNFVNHHTGNRAAYETGEVRKNLELLLEELTDNEEFWGGKTDGGATSDRYTPEDAVGVNSVAYWSDNYALRGNNTRILFNPYANNSRASIKGVNISGVSITQL